MPVNPPPKTQLDLLVSLENGQVVTQGTISKRLGVSIGMINALLKRAVHKGYVKVKAAPYKRYAYYLTPTGFAEKSRLVAEYLEISLRFFRQARQEYSELLERAERNGLKRLALVGGGELVEIACLAAHEAGVEFVAVVNREANRDRMLGLPVVRDLTELGEIDGVVIADSKAPQAVFDGLLERFEERRVLAPRLLRISRANGAGQRAGDSESALQEANIP